MSKKRIPWTQRREAPKLRGGVLLIEGDLLRRTKSASREKKPERRRYRVFSKRTAAQPGGGGCGWRKRPSVFALGALNAGKDNLSLRIGGRSPLCQASQEG